VTTRASPTKVRLLLASSTPIQRHIKVKSTANPYDPVDEPYFEKREADHMQDTFRGTRTLRFLWNEQRGLCPICSTKITRNTGWRAHYCVPLVLGGSKGAGNRVLLHPECHDRVHRQRISVSKPRLLLKGVRPELCDWKLSRTVLRGLDGSNPVRLLAKAGVISAWFRSAPTACLFVCKPSMLIRQDNEFVTVVFLDTIERQPVLDTQRRYRLSTIRQKPMRMAAIVPGS
jgi:hypothetical protein